MTKSDPLTAFRAELIARREALDWTVSEAARQAGITKQRWAHIERGWEIKQGVRLDANPRRATVLKMARALRWPANEALECAGFLPTVEHEMERSSAWIRLDGLWSQLSEPQQWALVYVAGTMVNPRQWPEFAGTRTRPELTTRSGEDVVRVIDLGHIDDDVDESDRVRDEPEQHEGNG